MEEVFLPPIILSFKFDHSPEIQALKLPTGSPQIFVWSFESFRLRLHKETLVSPSHGRPSDLRGDKAIALGHHRAELAVIRAAIKFVVPPVVSATYEGVR